MSGIKPCVIAGVLTIGLGVGADAADTRLYEPTGADTRLYEPTGLVPGTPVYWDWSGVYLGGQWGATSGTFKPGNATGEMVAHLLRDTIIEGEAQISRLPQLSNVSTSGSSFGGFVGVNQQWEDVIIGLELNYNNGRLSADSADSIGRSYTASDGYRYDVFLNSRASVKVKDYGTFRARAGHIMGRFLPYAHVGVAVGRADISRSVSIDMTATDPDPANPPDLPPIDFNSTVSDSKQDAFIYGVSAGGGLDIAITPTIFLRGEYEYIHFFPFKGMTLGIHTGRVGAAVKF